MSAPTDGDPTEPGAEGSAQPQGLRDPSRYEGIEGAVVRELSPSRRELLASVPWLRLELLVDKEARALARRVTVKGFRPGKAPVSRVRALHAATLRRQAVDALVQEVWQECQEAEGLRPVQAPVLQEMEVEQGRPVRFSALFEVMPRIALTGLDEIRVDDQVVKVEDRQVDEELERLRGARARVVDSEREDVSPGDVALVDLYRFAPGADPDDGEPDESREDVLVEVGVEGSLPELDRALLGMAVGEVRKFKGGTGDDAEGDAAGGGERWFRVLLKGIKERVLPDLDDAFVKGLDAGFSTVGELRDDIREKLLEAAREQAISAQDREVVRQLVEKNPVEIPPSLVEAEAEARLRRGIQGLAARGVDVENARIDWKAEIERARRSAEEALRADYLLELVAEERDVEVSEEDVRGELERLASRRGADVRQVRRELDKSGRMNDFKDTVRRQRTLDMLKSGATVTVDEARSEDA